MDQLLTEDLSAVLDIVGETVVRDLSDIAITNFENTALERTEWIGTVRAAETHPGLWSYEVSKLNF